MKHINNLEACEKYTPNLVWRYISIKFVKNDVRKKKYSYVQDKYNYNIF